MSNRRNFVYPFKQTRIGSAKPNQRQYTHYRG